MDQSLDQSNNAVSIGNYVIVPSIWLRKEAPIIDINKLNHFQSLGLKSIESNIHKIITYTNLPEQLDKVRGYTITSIIDEKMILIGGEKDKGRGIKMFSDVFQGQLLNKINKYGADEIQRISL